MGYVGSLAICNVPESSLARESDLVLMTRAGPEIGVASTKAFTTQLAGAAAAGGGRSAAARRIAAGARGASWSTRCATCPAQIEAGAGAGRRRSPTLAEDFVDKHHALFLGRGVHYPIAMEGALKLKEISYIHAEAYAGRRAQARPAGAGGRGHAGGRGRPQRRPAGEAASPTCRRCAPAAASCIVFADAETGSTSAPRRVIIHLPATGRPTDPPLFTVPLQLLAYHVALLKGTDVDKPRNLAKSVTVE
ncbi:MAG: SIS domain-containing protein [Halofilum sp. (in: g-proteobacteria)]|nr:SIS domain-containing protein [Halofilum sp. (in: g-proteobacteria)]